MKFANQVVLVTGASRGIGREIARLFAQEGAHVAIHYNSNLSAAEATRAELAGTGHRLFQAELGDPQAVSDLVQAVVAQMGGLQILVNNAGIYEDHPLPDVDYADWVRQWQEIIGVNLIGTANVMYCASRHMIAHGGGRIVNVSSRGAFRGEPDSPAYGASKAGMNSLGQSLAKKLAPHGVFVHTVAPGFVETEMATESLKGEAGDAIRAQSPLNRVARPEEIAQLVLLLASPGTEWATGAILDANGASYLRT